MNKHGLFVMLMVSAVLLSGCAGLTASPIGGGGPAALPDWVLVSIVAILTSFILIAIVYMAAHLVSSQELIAWAKNEFMQNIAVTIMFGILIVFFSFLDTMLIPGITANSLGGPYDLTGNNMFTAAESYLVNLTAIFVSEFTALLYLNVAMGLFQDATIRVMPMGIGFMIQPGSLFTPLFHFVGYALNFLGIAMWAVQLQFAILQFSKMYMFHVFLPLGIVFRSLPFTRSVGAALIAVALAFYVVYPLTFLLNMAIFDNHYSIVNHPLLITTLNAQIFQFSEGDILNTGTPLDLINLMWFIAKLILSVGLNAVALPLHMCFMLFGDGAIIEEMFYSIVVFTMILPIINVFITLTFARGFANIFGADVDLSSITRLI